MNLNQTETVLEFYSAIDPKNFKTNWFPMCNELDHQFCCKSNKVCSFSVSHNNSECSKIIITINKIEKERI